MGPAVICNSRPWVLWSASEVPTGLGHGRLCRGLTCLSSRVSCLRRRLGWLSRRFACLRRRSACLSLSCLRRSGSRSLDTAILSSISRLPKALSHLTTEPAVSFSIQDTDLFAQEVELLAGLELMFQEFALHPVILFLQFLISVHQVFHWSIGLEFNHFCQLLAECCHFLVVLSCDNPIALDDIGLLAVGVHSFIETLANFPWCICIIQETLDFGLELHDLLVPSLNSLLLLQELLLEQGQLLKGVNLLLDILELLLVDTVRVILGIFFRFRCRLLILVLVLLLNGLGSWHFRLCEWCDFLEDVQNISNVTLGLLLLYGCNVTLRLFLQLY